MNMAVRICTSIVFANLCIFTGTQASSPADSTAVAGTQQSYKMTTAIPLEITVPASVETRLGTLTYFDGLPDEATVRKVYDNLDFQRAVEIFLDCQAAPSLLENLEGARGIGIGQNSAGVFEQQVDSRALALTPNTQTVTLTTNFDLRKTGPMVIEIPAGVLGLADDAWMRYVIDMGMVGPDKGKGGKYLFVPPGYDGAIPEGYFVAHPLTNNVWMGLRGFTVKGDPGPANAAFKKSFRMYPLAEVAHPPATHFVNMSGKPHNTIQATDYRFFEQLNHVIQDEPIDGVDPETLGFMASIGIEKGKPFAPDERMKRLLTEAAAVGSATARAIAYRPRDSDFYYYPGKAAWTELFVGGSYDFVRGGARYLDARTAFFYTATGVTPAMAAKTVVGQGSQYAVAAVDAKGNYFDGSKNYRLHLPPNVPAKTFWSVIVYDSQTRSLLQTDQPGAGVSSEQSTVKSNSDGSIDVYFGPNAPLGHAGNWIQTIPGKGWFTFFRLYGPLQPWFDQTWRLPDFEIMR
jgi:hypothetical protein